MRSPGKNLHSNNYRFRSEVQLAKKPGGTVFSHRFLYWSKDKHNKILFQKVPNHTEGSQVSAVCDWPDGVELVQVRFDYFLENVDGCLDIFGLSGDAKDDVLGAEGGLGQADPGVGVVGDLLNNLASHADHVLEHSARDSEDDDD